MAITQDVTSIATRKLFPTYVDNFSKFDGILDHMFTGEGAEMSDAGGPYREFSLVYQGPGTATHIATGSESYGGTNDTISKLARVDGARVVYAFDLPCKDVDEANADPTALKKLLNGKMKAAVQEFFDGIKRQLLTGDVQTWKAKLPGIKAYGTLNGDVTGLPTTGLDAGLLQFVAPASQTGTFHGLTRSVAGEVYNQFPESGAITDFAAHGEERIKQAYNEASLRAPSSNYLMVSDRASFEKYESNLRSDRRIIVSIRNPEVYGGDRSANAVKGLAFGDRGIWYPSLFLDDTSTAFDSARRSLGIGYGVALEHLHSFFYNVENATKKNEDGSNPFGVYFRGPTKVPRQDVYEYELILHYGWYTDRPNANFSFIGMKA